MQTLRIPTLAALALAALVCSGPTRSASAAPVVDPLTDTRVFPIAVWSMPASTAPAFAEMGVNVFVGDQGRSAAGWCDTLAQNRCVGFVGWHARRSEAQQQAIAASPGFLGWMHGDEPDNPDVVDGEFMPYHVLPQTLLADYQAMRASSTPAPMYLNLGQGLANGAAQSTPDSVYPAFCRTADVVCYDVYPTSTQESGAQRLHLVARGVEHLRQLAGPQKPVWIWLECTRIDGARSGVGNRCPLPHELRAEVWMSVLHGADGIGYFPHQFNPYRGGPAAIPASVQAEMKRTNALLHRLAPVLRTGARQSLSVDAGAGRVDAVLWRLGEQVLVAAVNMRCADGRATVRLPAGVGSLAPLGASGPPLAGDTIGLALRPYQVALYSSGIQMETLDYAYPEPVPTAATAAPVPAALPALADLPQVTDRRGPVAWCRTHNTRLAVPVLAVAPAVDGHTGEAAWGPAAMLAPWTRPDGTASALLQTLGRVGRQDGRLYLGFTARETALDSLVTRHPAAWQNDCVEAWLDPGNRRTSFAHLIATTDGRVEATRTVEDEWGEGRRDDAWRPRVECRTERAADAWTLELSLALADLGAVTQDSVIGFDLGRERQIGNGEVSAWTSGGFNAARYFGELVLSAAEVTLSGGTLHNSAAEARTARVEVVVSAPRAAAEYAAWEEKWTDLARQVLTVTVPASTVAGPGAAALLTPALAGRVPVKGRVKLVLVEPGPLQFEELVGN